MKLRRVEIHNIRCFKSLEIDFSSASDPVILSGDNSSGKSTLLRCIALGLCDITSASALLLELPGEFIRGKKNFGSIKIEFSIDSRKYKIDTKFTSLRTVESISQVLTAFKKGSWQEVSSDKFPWNRIFTAGYGAGIRSRGTVDYDAFSTVDALYPLFKYDHPLQQPELVLRRISETSRNFNSNKEQDWILRPYFKILQEALGLPSTNKLRLTSTGIEIYSSERGSTSLNAHGDGYRSIINMVLDILSWWYLYKKMNQRRINVDPSKITGLILIDEIEQHLHPNWQLQIISKFSNAFPKIQLIVATHSPLVMSGYPSSKVIRLESGVPSPQGIEVYGWEAEDIYREIMGLPKTRALSLQKIINDYRDLFLESQKSSLPKKELNRLRILRNKITHASPKADWIAPSTEIDAYIKLLNEKD